MIGEYNHQSPNEGQLVDISMFDASIAWNRLAAGEYLVSGEERERERQQLNGGSFYGYSPAEIAEMQVRGLFG